MTPFAALICLFFRTERCTYLYMVYPQNKDNNHMQQLMTIRPSSACSFHFVKIVIGMFFGLIIYSSLQFFSIFLFKASWNKNLVPLNYGQYVHQFITMSITRILLPLSSYVLTLENNKKIIGFHAILCDALRITCSKTVQILKLNIEKGHFLKKSK